VLVSCDVVFFFAFLPSRCNLFLRSDGQRIFLPGTLGFLLCSPGLTFFPFDCRVPTHDPMGRRPLILAPPFLCVFHVPQPCFCFACFFFRPKKCRPPVAVFWLLSLSSTNVFFLWILLPGLWLSKRTGRSSVTSAPSRNFPAFFPPLPLVSTKISSRFDGSLFPECRFGKERAYPLFCSLLPRSSSFSPGLLSHRD